VVDEKARTGVAALDGCYVIKSDVPRDKAHRETLHARYKDLAFVERDFRDMKTARLEVRPVYVRKRDRTRGHVFVVMLALLLKRYMERLLHASMEKTDLQ
jgi:transposase